VDCPHFGCCNRYKTYVRAHLSSQVGLEVVASGTKPTQLCSYVGRTILQQVFMRTQEVKMRTKRGGGEEGGVSPPSRNYEFLRTRYVITTNAINPLRVIVMTIPTYVEIRRKKFKRGGMRGGLPPHEENANLSLFYVPKPIYVRR